MDLVIYSANVAAFCFGLRFVICIVVLYVVDVLVCLSVLVYWWKC